MKKRTSIRVLCGLILTLAPLAPANEWKSPHSLESELKAPVALLPFPAEVQWKTGTCPVGTKPVLQKADIKDEAYGAEGYSIDITPNGITVKAAAPAGAFYAKQTLAQLGVKGVYPCCTIKDRPAFPMRGLLHDTGRNFRSLDTLKHDLDEMSKIKMNIFQWHLTDYPAWRIECKKYPVLNDPSKRIKGRDVNDTYSYKQIRELFQYAKDRQIQIIPEIDMPGHSTYFNNCFGEPMNSEKGMGILEELLDELCAEIPREICPYIHIGADEVHIPNAREFVKRMSDKVISHGRTPMQWKGPNDLPVGDQSIAQPWGDERSDKRLNANDMPGPFVDSSAGYMNSLDPALLVRRYFFRQPCSVASHKDNPKCLGAIACLWPDTRVEDKAKIPFQTAQWPGLFAMAERTWCGAPEDVAQYAARLTARDTEAYRAFASFEKRMQALSGNKPFPYWRDSFVTWQVSKPVPTAGAEQTREQILAQKADDNSITANTAIGGNLYLKSRAGLEGLYNKTGPGQTVWAKTTLYADTDKTIHAMIGFDAPSRSTRRASGVPEAGKWSQCGTRIWLNGKEFTNPQTYRLAGKNQFKQHTWTGPANEMPFENEEFWWCREPVAIKLKKGANTLLVEQPFIGDFQSWYISFIPVKKQGDKWVADDSVSKDK